MKAEFLEKRKAPEDTEKPLVGHYYPDELGGKWYKCREQFADVFQENSTALFFCIQPGEAEKVAEFIIQTEQILDFPTSQQNGGFTFSQFALTNRDYCMWVKPSTFWMDCMMKRQFYTIMLRCGRGYDVIKKNYDLALWDDSTQFSNGYTQETKQAIQRFLFGNTVYVPPSISLSSSNTDPKGWVWAFKGKSSAEIKKMLLAPSWRQREFCEVFKDSMII